jgi:tetratricopeptide (TPR) repeat protein
MPDSAITLINLCIALTDSGKPAEAIECGQRALALNPNIPEAHFNLALALQAAGRIQEARERYDFARRQKSTLPVVPSLEHRG